MAISSFEELVLLASSTSLAASIDQSLEDDLVAIVGHREHLDDLFTYVG